MMLLRTLNRFCFSFSGTVLIFLASILIVSLIVSIPKTYAEGHRNQLLFQEKPNPGKNKIGLHLKNKSPIDINLVLYNYYQVVLRDPEGDFQLVKTKNIILGFYGFKPSILQANHLLLSDLSLENPVDLFTLIKGVMDKNSFSFELSNTKDLKICCFKEQRGIATAKQACGLFGIQNDNFPVFIIWNTKEESDPPFSDLLIYDFNQAVTKTDNTNPLFTQIPIEKEVYVIKSNANHTASSVEQKKTPTKYYSAPDINPELIPAIRKVAQEYLKSNKKKEFNKAGDSISFSLLPRNAGVTANCKRKTADAVKEEIPFQATSLPIRFEQAEENRRGNAEDPEFQALADFIRLNIVLYIRGQRIFIDSSKQVQIPDFLLSQGQPEAISKSPRFEVYSTRFELNEKNTLTGIVVSIKYKKSQLTVNILNKNNNLPVSSSQVFIDYKKNIYSGKLNSGDKLSCLLYDHPLIRYRISVTNSEFENLSTIPFINPEDFTNGLTLKLAPKPAFNFYYISDFWSKSLELPGYLTERIKQITSSGEKFLIYFSHEEAPLIVTRESSLQDQITTAFHFMSTHAQLEFEKRTIIDALPLDSIPQNSIIKLNFLYSADEFADEKGGLPDQLSNELTSGIFHRKTSVNVISPSEIPSDLRKPGYHYLVVPRKKPK